MKTPRTTLLITLTGPDRPGVTSRLFAVLARHPLSVLDVEQVVIRGKLVLGALLECDGPPDLTGIHAAVTALAADLGLGAEITTGSGSPGGVTGPGRGRAAARCRPGGANPPRLGLLGRRSGRGRAAARDPAGQPAGPGRDHRHR